MALAPRLDLRQSQSLVMTPQLQQAIKLLTLSSLEIEAYIASEIERNPLLENAGADTAPDDVPEIAGESVYDPERESGDIIASSDMAASEALDVDYGETTFHHDSVSDRPEAPSGGADGMLGLSGDYGGGGSGEDTDFDSFAAEEASLHDYLKEQAGAMFFGQELALVLQLIEEVDPSGYLGGDILQMAHRLGVSLDDMEDALLALQMLDPTGVGARDLAECLAIQARAANRYDPCMQRLIENLDLVARGSFDQLRRLCRVDEEDLRDMLSELRGYDPKPGARFGGDKSIAVTPDIFVVKREHSWSIELNSANLPRLLVNRSYLAEFGAPGADKATKKWLNECVEDANWLIRAMDQRQNTILKVATEILKQQEGFFREGTSQLRPLTLRQVADAIDMHESTVSRVTSNKYLSCDRGIFDLKYFFSSGVASADGEGASAEAVKAAIKTLVAGEGTKILSDDKLVELLKKEGFDLARRTVAKYREAMGIGSSVQRRRQVKMGG